MEAWSQDKLEGLEYLQYNPQRARALLQEAGVGDTPVPIDFRPDPQPSRHATTDAVVGLHG